MKNYLGLFAGLLLFASSVFVGKLFAQENSSNWGEWVDTSSCVASVCGTSNGTKNQERKQTAEVCDLGCPTLSFSANKTECPTDDAAYTSDDSSKECKKNFSGGTKKYADPIVVESFGPIDVVYGLKSEDPHKCHKPNASSLDVPSWAVSDYNQDNNTLPDWKEQIKTNCRLEVVDTETRIVGCSDAQIIACEIDPTPTPIVTATPNPDVCLNLDGIQTSVPNDYHLDASGKNCVQFGQPGSPTDSGIGGGQVLGTSTGQVLGTSTMAATGGAMDAIFYSMFTFGSLLTSFGIMKNGKKAQI